MSFSSRKLWLLVFDLLATFLSGWIALAFDHSLSVTIGNFGRVLECLIIFSFFYLAGFFIWRTFDSFKREFINEDFFYSAAGVGTGSLLSAIWIYAGMPHSICDYHDIILQFVFSLILIRAIRSIIRLHFYYYSRRSENNGSYGLSDMTLLNMELSQLLSRDPIKIDEEIIRKEISGHCVLVTGAAGSIGRALVLRLASYKPGHMVIIDQAETPLHDLELELRRDYVGLKFTSVLCSVCDKVRLEPIFERYKPQIVFHAAAYKHVSMMQQNIVECIHNNVYGTVNVAEHAIKHGCNKFILISSDKAVNPTGIMGCSKRICEIYCQVLAESQKGRGCVFITTRFGNVLGSNGSVVPIFRDQIRRGGPLTLTHPDVIRYFMLVEEACDLVLEASALGKSGEIFVFDMGTPVRIQDLAKKMIKISRRSDIKIEYIGLQPGEKLFEEILADREKFRATANSKLWIAEDRAFSFDETIKQIEELMDSARGNNIEKTLKLMHHIVPEFKEVHNGSK